MVRERNKKIIEWSKIEQELINNDDYDDDDDDEEDEDEEDGDLDEYSMFDEPESTKQGIFGFKPVNKFKLYEVNTNFYIDRDVALLMEYTDGVELMTVLTPYKCIIGVGYLFDPKMTEKRVRDKITNHFFSKEEGLFERSSSKENKNNN